MVLLPMCRKQLLSACACRKPDVIYICTFLDKSTAGNHRIQMIISSLHDDSISSMWLKHRQIQWLLSSTLMHQHAMQHNCKDMDNFHDCIWECMHAVQQKSCRDMGNFHDYACISMQCSRTARTWTTSMIAFGQCCSGLATYCLCCLFAASMHVFTCNHAGWSMQSLFL